jgi:hypothetical protein
MLKKFIHTVIKNYEDSDNSESKTSSKVSFYGSLDFSPGVENLFKAIGLGVNSSSLNITMDLCIINDIF